MKFSTLLAGILAPVTVMGAPSKAPQPRDLLELVETRDVDQSSSASHHHELAPRTNCNTPTNRACWEGTYNIDTDMETTWPHTTIVRQYTLTLTEVDNYMGPDGVVKRKVMLVNNGIIGPTLFANWGDYLEVTVINNMVSNGTSIHWHGMHQRTSVLSDGANGVTECPIAPGSSKVYRFKATQHGTSWYHSHFSVQYGNGVVGSIVIYGPASTNYDIDLGVFPIQDYYHRTADEIVEAGGFPPPSENVLFNGTAKNHVTGAGTWYNITLEPTKKHRLRLINPSVDNHFQLSIVGHDMTIIAADMVPVTPRTVSSLFLGVGQRYDVIIHANHTIAPAGNSYWFNVTFGGQDFCGSCTTEHPAAIVRYAGTPAVLPTNEGPAVPDHQCQDLIDLEPVVTKAVNPGTFSPNLNNTIPVKLDTTGAPIFIWKMNSRYITTDWDKPVLEYVMTNNDSYPAAENLIHIPQANQWVYWLIENDPNAAFISVPHPIHLHGHDFLILGRSPDETPGSQAAHTFNPAVDNARLNVENPLRRDVAMLPARGWLLIAFYTDNPGAWLMHCHIAWHVAGGLSVDFLERIDDLKNSFHWPDRQAFNDNCANWRAHTPLYPKIDSGLRR